MFEPALKSLGHSGRLLEISSAGDRRVSFDLTDFYHNESKVFGVDTRARDAIASAALLEALAPFFEQGAFRPPAIDRVFALTDGAKAYEEGDRGQVRGRIVLAPSGTLKHEISFRTREGRCVHRARDSPGQLFSRF